MKSGARIYIIEDDREIRLSLAAVLENSGFRTAHASNGQEAFDYLVTAKDLPQLILLDLMMPIMDGWGFRALQLKNEKMAKIPIIVISAGGDVERKAKNLGAAGWLRKPFEIDTLIAAIEKHLVAS